MAYTRTNKNMTGSQMRKAMNTNKRKRMSAMSMGMKAMKKNASAAAGVSTPYDGPVGQRKAYRITGMT